MTTVERLIEIAERLSTTSDSSVDDDGLSDLDVAVALFNGVLDLFHLIYFNPGEPGAECQFCGRNRALPGAYDVCDSDDVELGDDTELGADVYWARVWAVRALDILDPAYVEDACCLERDKLWATLEL